MIVRPRIYTVTEAWRHDGTPEAGEALARIVNNTPTYSAGKRRHDGAFWITRTVGQQEVESFALTPGLTLVTGGARLTVLNKEDFESYYEKVNP